MHVHANEHTCWSCWRRGRLRSHRHIQGLCQPAGCKLNNVPIVYTPWANLKKTADMDIGQV